MTQQRFALRASVYVFLFKDNQTLLARRFNTGWGDGYYSLLAGHLDAKESLVDAAVREAIEEGGIIIQPEDLHLGHVMHRMIDDDYLDFFFIAEKWENEPHITEPDKCDDMRWFPLDKLPENILPYVKLALKNYQNGITFSEVKR